MAKAKIDANRGDLFEAFFAAAVAARFVKRMEKKTERKLPLVEGKDVDKVLTEMMKRGYKKKVNDVGSAIMDTVSVSVSICLLYTSPSPRDMWTSRMPSSA